MAKRTKSLCTKLSPSDCKDMIGCSKYRRAGKTHCRTKRGAVTSAHPQLKVHVGPKGGKYVIRKGRKVYLK